MEPPDELVQTCGVDPGGVAASVGQFACQKPVVDADGNDVERYVYDKAGNMVRKTVNGKTTTFTFDGAKALKRLGVCAIVIPIAAKIVAEIAAVVLEHALDGADTFEVGDPVSVSLGIMMLVASLLCRHGAELRQGNQQV